MIVFKRYTFLSFLWRKISSQSLSIFMTSFLPQGDRKTNSENKIGFELIKSIKVTIYLNSISRWQTASRLL